MSNFFQDVLGDLDAVEQELLGPDYSYSKQIKTPNEINISSDPTWGAIGANAEGIIAYVEILFSGGGNASRVDGPLGDKFFLRTGARCKDVDSGKQVTSSVYINNVPDGDIPFLSGALDMNFSEAKGLIPGTFSNLAHINPLAIFQSFMSGTNPDCKAITMPTVDASNNRGSDTKFLTVTDIRNMPACWFENGSNPITKERCNEAFTNIINKDSYDFGNFIALIYFISLASIIIYMLNARKKF